MAAAPAPTLKRKHTDSDSTDTAAAASQGIKRQRVAFDNDVKVHIVQDWNEKGLELVREEVRRGIEKHVATGDNNSYDQIRHHFTLKPGAEDAPSTTLLKKYVIALTRSVTLLNRNCSSLVHAILDCQWLGRDEEFVNLYGKLLGSLMSAYGGYTGGVMRMLVSNFARLPASAGRLADHAIVRRDELESRNHTILKYLLRLVPSASGSLSSALSTGFPFPTENTKIHVAYISNLLRVTQYAPELKGEIIALVIERLVKIDVQFQVDMDELDEDLQESLLSETHQLPTQPDPVDDEDDESDSDSDETITPDERRLRELKELVNKTDLIMNMLFEYYHPIFATGTISEVDDAFEHLLIQFESTIVPTYRSRHTQFLLFHFGQASGSLIERFIAACAGIAFDKSRPQITRFAAAAYLASFVSRGAHVTKDVVRNVFCLLVAELDNLRRNHEPTCTGPDPRRFGGYYAIAQAILYTFCFRWRDLVELAPGEENLTDDELLWEGRQIRWISGIKTTLDLNIRSPLNPLKVCSPVIVQQFEHISRHLKFIYVHHLIENNKRVMVSWSVPSNGYGGIGERETALSAKKGDARHQLDAFFPFDPYQLPRSKAWVEGDYNAWKGIAGVDEEDNEDDEMGTHNGSDSESEEEEEDIDSDSDDEGVADDHDDFDDGTATDRSA